VVVDAAAEVIEVDPTAHVIWTATSLARFLFQRLCRRTQPGDHSQTGRRCGGRATAFSILDDQRFEGAGCTSTNKSGSPGSLKNTRSRAAHALRVFGYVRLAIAREKRQSVAPREGVA